MMINLSIPTVDKETLGKYLCSELSNLIDKCKDLNIHQINILDVNKIEFITYNKYSKPLIQTIKVKFVHSELKQFVYEHNYTKYSFTYELNDQYMINCINNQIKELE